MPEVPTFFSSVAKPDRKIFLERSGRSSARFESFWIPFDGVRPAREWGEIPVSEIRSLAIPDHVVEGSYSIQVSAQPGRWRPRFDLRDYLVDEDRFSGRVVGQLWIGEGGAINGPGESAP